MTWKWVRHVSSGHGFARAGPEPWNAAYVQPSRRPTDGRYGENPNRFQHYYQFQVILKPSPDNIQQLYLDSLQVLGIDRPCTISVLLKMIGKARRWARGGWAGKCGAMAWKFPNSPIFSKWAALTVRWFRAS